jgi:REP element-mobilizing transposase RayT
VLEEGFLDPAKPLHIRWGDLPHWRQDGGFYFVTFRLSDSLPQILLEKWRQEQKEWRTEHEGADREMLMRRSLEQQRRVERWLDRRYGSCILADPAAQRVVANALRHFDGVRYELGDSAVAANHVHALLRTALEVDLSEVLYSWKRFTSAAMLKTTLVRKAFDGYRHVWQKESFDHLVRNRESLDKIRRYIQRHEG